MTDPAREQDTRALGAHSHSFRSKTFNFQLLPDAPHPTKPPLSPIASHRNLQTTLTPNSAIPAIRMPQNLCGAIEQVLDPNVLPCKMLPATYPLPSCPFGPTTETPMWSPRDTYLRPLSYLSL